MLKKTLAAAVLISTLALGNNFCLAADSFQTIYNENNFSEDMKNNEARTETFNTPYGEMKFQMRKLWTDSKENKMHVMIWLKDKKIYFTTFTISSARSSRTSSFSGAFVTFEGASIEESELS